MFREIILNDSTLRLLLGVVSLLFVLSVVRLFLLFRANRILRRNIGSMEEQSTELHNDLLAILHESRSWRERMIRQFEAMRADSSARLDQSERSQEHLLRSLDDKIQENASKLLASSQTLSTNESASATADRPSPTSTTQGMLLDVVPTLPAIETLRTQVLEEQISSLREQVHSYRQQCASLQRSLALCRRRQSNQLRKPSRTWRQS